MMRADKNQFYAYFKVTGYEAILEKIEQKNLIYTRQLLIDFFEAWIFSNGDEAQDAMLSHELSIVRVDTSRG